ncbi:MAG: hypothetical protein COX46_04685 [bacterium (Candidatus Ratteibacteria) CG23_combo_of_CG06-09_8_20_14_all_48_7]|uniref:Nucleotidyl transferase AbiEii/AbiGii toxin family protein n=1 Tax=bacterium (Candidatus Ratteibacteria) CG23_combo_of_CG06-09_8_20_14_all_48_7 TaxID=2014292 RepID=A0A2G9YB10_9BACT|nr:MAG: hypothetical protein COX46_04685 [bacterium (Candidatus Ratteibacteria) CG23_combo_of_CG06-09_8_20_14_all_48_7]
MLHEKGTFRLTAFLGGTALRFLYNLPRFSEDLDFSMVKKSAGYSFPDIIGRIKEEFTLAGYNLSVSYNDKKIVQHAFFKFRDLMYETGISPLKEQNFSIKIEIDTNPPRGAVLKTEIVNKYFPMAFLSYDLPSLFAGKIHAILNRKYTKGRDLFDLGWYLSRWKDLSPNITLLQNGLVQTDWKERFPTREDWRRYLYDVVEKVDWKRVANDVTSFLENPADLNIFTRENILHLIQPQKNAP